MQAAHGHRQVEQDVEPRHSRQKLQGKHAQLSGLVEKVKGGVKAGVRQQDQGILRVGGVQQDLAGWGDVKAQRVAVHVYHAVAQRQEQEDGKEEEGPEFRP